MQDIVALQDLILDVRYAAAASEGPVAQLETL